MAHSHTHGRIKVPPQVQRRLLAAVAPFLIATVIGLILLWPPADPGPDQTGTPPAPEYAATVVSVTEESCEGFAQGDEFVCSKIEAELAEGPDEGDVIDFRFSRGRGAGGISVGDEIRLAFFKDAPVGHGYAFVDFQRSQPLVILAVVFAVVVIATSRMRGVTALIGLALSILVLVKFMLPAILAGQNPLAVALVGSSAVMFVALYLAHGLNAATTTAVLGTLASLTLIAILASIFVAASRFTGLTSDEAGFLQVSAGQINLEGLLLGGIIVGALGVLDDVTVTQASAVWELRTANPNLSARQLYSSAIRIGRDHIASTVNTLVLAYAGASLPLLLIFSLSQREVGTILTTEVMAEEVVRTLVGSIGLVASVPITTALAAFAVTAGSRAAASDADEDWEAPAKEREFWDEG